MDDGGTDSGGNGGVTDVDSRSDGASRAGNDEEVTKTEVADTQTFEVTAYTAHCDSGCTGVTATGVDVSNGIYHEGKRVIAVDPSEITLGATVRITTGDGNTFEAVAIDTGGAIVGDRIDLLVGSEDEAWSFGRQSAQVEILR